MSVASTAAKLLASLELDTKPFEAGARRAGTTLGRMESRFAKIGSLAKQGFGNAVTNIKRMGMAAAAFVGANVFKGVESLAQLEDATTSVTGAIKQMGLTGRISAGQIAQWANEIESKVQAAFDDKDITAATATLIRYGKIPPKLLRPAMQVMTDLAARTGSVASASEALAKSLADPTKATRLLRQAGVTLTKEQTAQIKKWVESGKLAKAQAFLLDKVASSTKGAAAALKGPYNDALNILRDTIEDGQRALGEGFLPLIQTASRRLTAFISKPENIQKIRQFGRDLAAGFEKLLDFAGQIPWGTIGDSMKIAGAGAKVIFDSFNAMPEWVRTAVITGWGLNKLTGGAFGGIVSELAKGLIKGVLGINAGVVNINAGVVKGGGVGAGGPAVVGGAGNLLGRVVSIASTVFLAAGAGVVIGKVLDEMGIKTPNARDYAPGPARTLDDGTKVVVTNLPSLRDRLGLYPKSTRPLTTYGKVETQRGEVDWSKFNTGQKETNKRLTGLEKVREAVREQRVALKGGLEEVRSATQAAGRSMAAALANQQLRATVPITINVNGIPQRTYQGSTWLGRTTESGNIRGGAD